MFAKLYDKVMKELNLRKELLERISKGDTISFRHFYNQFSQKVYQFSHYYIKSDEICEEIVSDVFINIWLNKEKLPEVKNIEAYLYIIARNNAFNYLDKEGKSQESAQEITPELHVDTLNPEEILAFKELETTIQNYINQLPERCRIIFQMSREEKLTHKEIAKILSISENTVHAQMVTALKKLYDSIKKHIFTLL